MNISAPQLLTLRLPALLPRQFYSWVYFLRALVWLRLSRAESWPSIFLAWQRNQALGTPNATSNLAATDKLLLLTEGRAAFKERARLIDKAQQSIDISVFYWLGDRTGWEMAAKLAEATRRGVRVRLMVDANAMGMKRLEPADTDALIGFLLSKNVTVRFWRSCSRPWDVNHRKLLLVDGQYALIGGRNIADHYRTGDWRDIDLRVHGPSAGDLQRLFERMWRAGETAREPIECPNATPWVDYLPTNPGKDAIVVWTLARIASASTSIDMELAYFVDMPPLCDALIAARSRGVRVRLLTNAAEATDLAYTRYAAYRGIAKLQAAGIAVYAWLIPTLHSKYIVIDRRWVVFGSHNLDYYSSRFCCETNLLTESPRLATMLEEFFENGIARAKWLDNAREIQPLLRKSPLLRGLDGCLRDFQ